MPKSKDHVQDNGSGSDNSCIIDLIHFTKRLKTFYSHWTEHKNDLWGSSNVLVVSTPRYKKNEFRYSKSSALNRWLLSLEFTETIIVFMNNQIHYLCSQKKASMLEAVRKSTKETVGAETVMHVTVKNDDGAALMDEIFISIKDQSNSSGQGSLTVGYIAKEAPEGIVLVKWAEKLESSGLLLTDITNGISDLLAVKDAIELSNVKKAARLTSSVMNNFVKPELMKIVDEEKKVSHSSLMGDTKKVILEPARVKVELKAEDVSFCYHPIFQSGCEFDLTPFASSNDANLYYDSTSIIICAIGSCYMEYCSNAARTFLIDANAVQSKAYEALLKAQKAAIGALKPGNKVSAAYEAALSVVHRDAPEFAQHLTKSAGTGIGLEFRESGLNLDAQNERILKAGMVFNVSLGFQNLQGNTNNPKTEVFSLLLADTVIINGKLPEVVTTISKAFKNVNYIAPIRLQRLRVRGLKINGCLEAHENRFSYYFTNISETNKREEMHVNIMYDSIKHAFFHAAEKERSTVLHLHLHNQIKVWTKEIKDLQFYIKVINTQLGERSANDPGEIEERQRQAEKRNRINRDFQTFVDKVNDLWRRLQCRAPHLKFEQPMRDLGFKSASGFIAPCSSCLVKLTGTPFLVVTLSEIGSVELEHVELKEMTFDMSIVFKDPNCDVLRIECIPSFYLDRVNNWLQETGFR